jgi:hypothetical protein
VKILFAAALVALLVTVCRANGEGDEDDAVPGLQPFSSGVIYYDSSGPLSFPSMTPKDVPKGVTTIREVKGRACQRGLAIPTAVSFNSTHIGIYFGNGGYGKALAQIKRRNPRVIGLYDVRTDVETFSILGVYQSLCTEVTARAFALASPPAAAPPELPDGPPGPPPIPQ